MNYLQKQKIEKQLSFFERLDYEVTKVLELPNLNGEYWYCELIKDNFEVICTYVISKSGRISSRYHLKDITKKDLGNHILAYNVKSFKEFRKHFENN
jgi:hypothetical protein